MTKQTKMKCRRFTPRQLALLNGLSMRSSITQPGRSARSIEEGNDGKLASSPLEEVPETISQLLDECGLSREALIEQYLKPLSKARSRSQRRVTHKRLVAAHETSLRALDTALRLHGAYPSKTKPSEAVKHNFVEVIVVDNPRPRRPAPGTDLPTGCHMDEISGPVFDLDGGSAPLVKRAARAMSLSNDMAEDYPESPKPRLFFES
jgi:hypothetical protein